MIAVKIELWPCGDETGAREIGRMYIANDGRASVSDPSRGDYVVGVCRRGTDEVPLEIYQGMPGHDDQPKAARAGEVKDYPRLAYNVWRLIARAVLAAFPEEVPRGKPKGTPVLDAQVMQGLQLLADLWQKGDQGAPINRAAISSALDWLDAAARDDIEREPSHTVPA